jgi:alkyl hydroperoxide reductase subunit AhpF
LLSIYYSFLLNRKKVELLAERFSLGGEPQEWTFPVKYDVENRVETDVLIVGAGLAGGMAGIMAARRGVKVAVVDKSPINISGCAGSGIDHWLICLNNPKSP